MIPATLRIVATWLVLSVTAVLVAGCGGSGRTPAETHLAAVANAACREAENLSLHHRLKAELAELRALLRSDEKLPRVAIYIADVQARDRLLARLRKLSYKEYESPAVPLLKESTLLKRKVEADLKALGWTSCGTRLFGGDEATGISTHRHEHGHRVRTGTSVALVEDANREPIQLKLRCALTDPAHNVQDGAPTNLCAFIWLQ